MGKIVSYRLKWYLETNDPISNCQPEFRYNFSTYDTLSSIQTGICDAFKKEQQLFIVSFDIEKTHDMM